MAMLTVVRSGRKIFRREVGKTTKRAEQTGVHLAREPTERLTWCCSWRVWMKEGRGMRMEQDGEEEHAKKKKNMRADLLRGTGALPPCAIKEGVVLHACADINIIGCTAYETDCMSSHSGAWTLLSSFPSINQTLHLVSMALLRLKLTHCQKSVHVQVPG